ncbi:helix-turn-helix domain-containing protein [Embleya sp. NPDC008237]|uniref:helix-turn-helix domain-containing protein n=1 Tax=Embleya sp. NPDC008237 TaxID=3363978 RepID=UPI0036E7C02F
MADNQTVTRRRLGNELRSLREAAGLSREHVAEHMEWSNAKVWRIESGKVGIRSHDVTMLCRLYSATDELTSVLGQLAREARATVKSWWHTYNDVLPDWFGVYVNLEDGAAEIRAYEAELIPGLFQTPEYAGAILRAAQPDATDEEIERRVGLRMARQKILERPRAEAPRLWMIINEAALRRRVGGPAVMRAQLTRLQETAAKPGIHIQVLKFSAGAHTSMLNAFSMLTFRDTATPAEAGGRSAARPVVYLEQLTSALYLEKAHEIDAYTVAFEHLQANATRPAALNAMIDEILKEF